MKNNKLNTPVLMVIFNRPETTLKVFEQIKIAKPSQLFIFADAPRANVVTDLKGCSDARKIVEEIDWQCDVHLNFQEENIGCDLAVPSAINWFFEHVDSGIILEDDCVANQSFFFFCQELLEHYKEDTRIMHISGNNFLDGDTIGDASYYFSKEPLIWGWATWKRAWNHYHQEMDDFMEFDNNNEIKNIYNDFMIQKGRMFHFKKIYRAKPIAWDFRWLYSVYIQNGLCITPNVNLITNVGFCENSLHSANPKDRYANMQNFSIDKIVHPRFFIPNTRADVYTLKNHLRYGIKGIIEKILTKSLLKFRLRSCNK